MDLFGRKAAEEVRKQKEIEAKKLEQIIQRWQKKAPEFYEAVVEMSKKYAHASEGSGFQYRFNLETGALETNIPKLKYLMDCSMPPLLKEPDGQKGISYHLSPDLMLFTLLEKESPTFLKAVCGDSPELVKVIFCSPKELKMAAFVLDGWIVSDADFSSPPPRVEAPASGFAGLRAGISGVRAYFHNIIG